MNPTPILPSPPGSSGLPLLGETLDFARDGFAFSDRRVARHGRVFRTHLLGRNAVFICGLDASIAWIDQAKIERTGSMPANIQELFGGRSLPLLDGAEHSARKASVLAGFGREALAAYLPDLEAVIAGALEKWAAGGEVQAVDEAKRLAIEAICRNVFSLAPGAETDRLRADYADMLGGFAALPIRLPGTAFTKALAARTRIFAVLERLVRERRAQPLNDALSRILVATAADGTTITDEAAVLEMHHVVVAGYIIYAEIVALLRELHLHPDVRDRVAEEIRRESPAGPLRPDSFRKLPYLLQVIREVKRLCPILPAVFGKAKSDFELGGFRIQRGWMVLWAWWSTLRDPALFTDPERFDPSRFAAPRNEHERHAEAFTPHGPGPVTGHSCPGADYATLFMQVFAVTLFRQYRYEIPPQNLDYVWSRTPPEPKDGLRIRVSRV